MNEKGATGSDANDSNAMDGGSKSRSILYAATNNRQSKQIPHIFDQNFQMFSSVTLSYLRISLREHCREWLSGLVKCANVDLNFRQLNPIRF